MSKKKTRAFYLDEQNLQEIEQRADKLGFKSANDFLNELLTACFKPNMQMRALGQRAFLELETTKPNGELHAKD